MVVSAVVSRKRRSVSCEILIGFCCCFGLKLSASSRYVRFSRPRIVMAVESATLKYEWRACEIVKGAVELFCVVSWMVSDWSIVNMMFSVKW